MAESSTVLIKKKKKREWKCYFVQLYFEARRKKESVLQQNSAHSFLSHPQQIKTSSLQCITDLWTAARTERLQNKMSDMTEIQPIVRHLDRDPSN